MMKSQDQEDFVTKKEALLRKFEGNTKPISNRGLDKEVRKLVVDLLALQCNLDAKDTEVRERLDKYATAEMAKFDPDEPRLASAAKLMRLLSKSLKGEATKYFGDLQTLRANEERKKQESRGKTTRGITLLDELLLKFVSRKPDIRPDEALEKLHDMRHEFPLYDVSPEYIFVYEKRDFDIENPRTKKYAVGGLGSRLSRLKNRLKSIS